MTLLALIATALAVFYVTWVLYLGIMNLKRAQQAGQLSPLAKVLGLPVLLLGFALDCLLNATLMSLLFLELPKESTVSARLKRHNRFSTGWRQSLAHWFEPLLDPFDPDGDHI